MRGKKREPYIFKPSTKELFLCISSAPKWVKLLLDHGRGKGYEGFLVSLLERKFFEEERNKERLTVKMMSEILNFKPSDITKWLGKIYDDLFELNMKNETLFQTAGIKHNLYFRYLYDNRAVFTVWLKQSPKKYETIHFPVVKAKVGTDSFWVKDIHHTITDQGHEIDLMLNGGILNRYREFLFDRAIFEGAIGLFEAYQLDETDIDKRLIQEYR